MVGVVLHQCFSMVFSLRYRLISLEDQTTKSTWHEQPHQPMTPPQKKIKMVQICLNVDCFVPSDQPAIRHFIGIQR